MSISTRIEHWLGDSQHDVPADERPFVTLSYAQSLDGSIALHHRAPLALSGQESLNFTHRLRSLHDGILVGIGTVLSDDPQLNVRRCAGTSPQPIVLDSQLRIPATSRVRNAAGKPCWVFTTENDPPAIDGLQITSMQGDAEGRVCLHRTLQVLRRRGIQRLMVEGGASVITAFLRAQLVDAVIITITPTLVGGYKAVSDLGVDSRHLLPQIAPFYSETMGADLIVWGNLRYARAAA